MAWGYEACFTIEHDDTLKRRIDCKDCEYYEKEDKSCLKTPRYLPEDGYNSWRQCNYFELKTTVAHYEEKKAQYIAWSRRMAKKEIATSKVIFTKNRIKPNVAPKVPVVKQPQMSKVTDAECRKLKLHEYENEAEVPKNVKSKLLDIYLDDGRKKSIQLALSKKRAYLKKNMYSDECMYEVRRLFRKN